MEKSNTTPVTASSFPKWKSNKCRYVIEKETGKKFFYEQDPLSLNWHNSEIETIKSVYDGNPTLICQNVSLKPVPVVKSIYTTSEILPISSNKPVKESRKIPQICDTNYSNVVNRSINYTNTSCKNLHQGFFKKTFYNPSSTFDSSKVVLESLQYDVLKIKQEPSDYYTGKIEHLPTDYYTGEIEQVPSDYYTGEIEQVPSDYYTGEIEQVPSDYYTGEIEQVPSDYYTGEIEQVPSDYYTGEIEQEPSNYYTGNIGKKNLIAPVKIKQEATSYKMVKIKREALDTDPIETNSQGHSFQLSVQEKPQYHSTTINMNGTSSLQNFPAPTIKNSSLKLELTRIDDILNIGSKSTVMLNSPSLKRDKKNIPDSGRPLSLSKTIALQKKALELKYRCFSAELKSKHDKRPDPNVLFNKTKLCRHSNRFQNGETDECGCAIQGFLKCDLCGEVVRSSDFTKHVKAHYKIKRYRCPFCANVFRYASNLNNHIKLRPCVRKKYQCFKCQEVFKKFNVLKHHLVSCTGNILP